MSVATDGVDKLTTMVNATNLGKPQQQQQPQPQQQTQRYDNRPKGSSVAFINHGGHQNLGPSTASTSTSRNIGNPSGISSQPLPHFT